MNEIDGDLLDLAHSDRALGHGVNLHGLMGGGVAKQIADRWPEIVPPYQERCASGALPLGGVWPVSIENGPRIYNLATQDAPGPNANMHAIWSSVSLALVDCWRHNIPELALPRIGCGIGGLEWAAVHQVLLHLDTASPVGILVVNYVS